LRVSEAWLSATFRNVADALITAGSDGNIARMNGAAERLTGWDHHQAIGKPLLDVFQAFEETTDLPVVHPLLANGAGPDLAQGPRTFRLMKPHGADPVLVEAELFANRDDGTLFGTIAVFRDVTERQKAERQSRQLEQ
jgi:PAS domain S-box-containing protein